MRAALVTDVGSTTTKALWFEPAGGRWRLLARAESATTVEWPWEDVTIGVRQAVQLLGEEMGRGFVDNHGRLALGEAERYLSTSSAGGGLQMLVCGATRKLTAESAERAALGAGAVILDVLASDDGRPAFAKLASMRSLRPDMILLAGGVDGGNVQFALELADLLSAANPRARFGGNFRLPVVYAGNVDAGPLVEDALGGRFSVKLVPNIRPRVDRENLAPAREAIHQLFMAHVMQHAPGYQELCCWVSAPILPTPAAVSRMVQLLSEHLGSNLMVVDIGGATTDVFTVFDGHFHRTVSANLGMSYSAGNVLCRASAASIRRWLPYPSDDDEVWAQVATKMLHPTTLPAEPRDLWLEQAVAREALRLSLEHHRQLAVAPAKELTPLERMRMSAEEQLRHMVERPSLVDTSRLGMLVGSGGVLSHAPQRAQAALMLLDGIQPTGRVELAVDSVFMLPHLGVLSTVDQEAAMELLFGDCLVPLGTALCLEGRPSGRIAARISYRTAGGEPRQLQVPAGRLCVIPLGRDEETEVEITPGPGLKMPAGTTHFRVRGGVVGLIIDGRGRPLRFPAEESERARQVAQWLEDVGGGVDGAVQP